MQRYQRDHRGWELVQEQFLSFSLRATNHEPASHEIASGMPITPLSCAILTDLQTWICSSFSLPYVAPSFLYQTLNLSTSSTSWILSSASSVSQSICSYHCYFLTVFRLPKLWSRSQLLIVSLNLTNGTQTVWYISNK